MAGYTYDDIITAKDVISGKVKKEDIIGVSGWFLDFIPEDMSLNVLGRIGHFGILKNIDLDRISVFLASDTGLGWLYFIPKKKETASFKVGDKVKIVKEWGGWKPGCKPTVGKTGIIETIGITMYSVYLLEDDDWWMYSSDALELIEETAEEKKYKPKYTMDDVISDPHDPRLEGAIGKWVFCHDFKGGILNDALSNRLGGLLVGINNNPDFPFNVDFDGDPKEWIEWRYIIIAKDQPSSDKEAEDKPEYEPFDLSLPEDRGAIRGKWIRNNNSGSEYQVISILHKNRGTYSSDWGVYLSNAKTRTALQLLDHYEFLDGAPCGRLKED